MCPEDVFLGHAGFGSSETELGGGGARYGFMGENLTDTSSLAQERVKLSIRQEI